LRHARTKEIEAYRQLHASVLERLPQGACPILPADAPIAPHILSIECAGKENDWIVLLMSREGVMVSAGSACKSGNREASAAVKALGLGEARAKSAIRVSFGWHNERKDADMCVGALEKALAR